MLKRIICLALFAWVQTSLAACAQPTVQQSVAPTQPSVAEIRATVEAELRATAQLAAAPSPSATVAPVTIAPTNALTVAAATAQAEPTQTPAPTPLETEASLAAQVPTTFEPAAAQEATTVNLELVFDSSGSMAEQIGGETKIAAARRAIEQVIGSLPADSATFNVGFRVFGHRGDNSEAGKAESCQSTELLVPIQGSLIDQLRAQAGAWEPTGWTPISLALEQAGRDFTAGENTRNMIIMVTDGEETCGGDPCAVAQSLAESNAEVRIDLVGFGLTPDVADVLRCVPQNSGGVYIDAQDGNALASSLQELITVSLTRSYLRILALDETGKPGKRTKFVEIADAQGNEANVLNYLQGNFAGLLAKGEALLELLPGTYTFTVTKNFIAYGGDAGAEGYTRTYTAVVEQGRETVATVGIGGMILTRGANADKRVLCDSVFEINLDGTWQEFPLPGLVIGCNESFIFDEEYLLPPGMFRIRDVERKTILVDNIVIEPGKRVTIHIQGGG